MMDTLHLHQRPRWHKGSRLAMVQNYLKVQESYILLQKLRVRVDLVYIFLHVLFGEQLCE
jgi:hypothetical protein